MVAILSLAVCGSFAYKAYAALQEPDVALPAPTPVAPRKPIPVKPPVDGSALVARNMFCSTCEPPVIVDAPAKPGETFTPHATLIATNVADRDSRATLRVDATQVQGNWGLGEAIAELGTVTRIGYGSIDITDAKGRIGKLSLLAAAAPAQPATVDAATSTVAAPSPYADSVKKIDDHTYEVKRELVHDLVAGASTGKGGIRATPILKNGEMAGIRLLTVKADSAPAAIGMKSGDVIESIGGEPLRTAQQMIDLYSKIDKLDAVDIGGTRAGKPLTLSLHLK